MPSHFDGSASTYDEVFTNSSIGKAQRDRVYYYLEKHLQKSPLRILEINCGTGADANYMAQSGHDVIATDISEGMISAARIKYPNITFEQLDITLLSSETFATSFDLVFSNFGGLNCLSKAQLGEFLKISEGLLAPQGELVLVIMPKHCLWERFYFSRKGDKQNARRRKNEEAVLADVEGVKVPTWYYNPKEIVTLATSSLKTLQIKPVGVTIPPSYLEPFFKKRKGLLGLLTGLEPLFSYRFWAKYADHYLISFQKR